MNNDNSEATLSRKAGGAAVNSSISSMAGRKRPASDDGKEDEASHNNRPLRSNNELLQTCIARVVSFELYLQRDKMSWRDFGPTFLVLGYEAQ